MCGEPRCKRGIVGHAVSNRRRVARRPGDVRLVQGTPPSVTGRRGRHMGDVAYQRRLTETGRIPRAAEHRGRPAVSGSEIAPRWRRLRGLVAGGKGIRCLEAGSIDVVWANEGPVKQGSEPLSCPRAKPAGRRECVRPSTPCPAAWPRGTPFERLQSRPRRMARPGWWLAPLFPIARRTP